MQMLNLPQLFPPVPPHCFSSAAISGSIHRCSVFHPELWLWHSLILALPLSVVCWGSGYQLWVKITVHWEEFLFLHTGGIYLHLWPAYYSSWVCGDPWDIYVLFAWILFPLLSCPLCTCLTFFRYLAVADLLASSSWFLLACGIPL